MARLVPNSLPVLLTDVVKNYGSNTIEFQTDTISTPGKGNISAPANAVFCRVQIYGAGGGAGKGISGGGGGFYEKCVPVVGGTTNVFAYGVGLGGTGSTSANGVAGLSSNVTWYAGPTSSNSVILTAYGGDAGRKNTKSSFYGAGGNAPNSLVFSTNVSSNGLTGNVNCGGNSGGISYAGGGSAGYGGNSSNPDGVFPGGGGYGSGTQGGNGANGKVVFIWYGPRNSNNTLLSFASGANGVPTTAVGYSGLIPSAGTINLSSFQGADAIGMANSAMYEFYDTNFAASPTNAAANAKLILSANGYFDRFYSNSRSLGIWLKHELTPADENVSQWFDTRITKTAGNGVLTGSNATWLQCNTNLHWNVYATETGIGANIKYVTVSIEFRRRSDNVIVSNSTANIIAWAEVYDTSPPSGGGTL